VSPPFPPPPHHLARVIVPVPEAMIGVPIGAAKSVPVCILLKPCIGCFLIPKEEDKVRKETRKILGKLKDGKIKDADIRVSCTCTRVPVIDGHIESVFVETEKEIDPALAKDTYDAYNKEISVAGLPSAPENYYAFHEDPTRPQPRMEREVGGGMTTTIGRVEKEELFDNGIKYILFSHNKKMGSAKGAVLLAEMLHKKDKI